MCGQLGSDRLCLAWRLLGLQVLPVPLLRQGLPAHAGRHLHPAGPGGPACAPCPPVHLGLHVLHILRLPHQVCSAVQCSAGLRQGEQGAGCLFGVCFIFRFSWCVCSVCVAQRVCGFVIVIVIVIVCVCDVIAIVPCGVAELVSARGLLVLGADSPCLSGSLLQIPTSQAKMGPCAFIYHNLLVALDALPSRVLSGSNAAAQLPVRAPPPLLSVH